MIFSDNIIAALNIADYKVKVRAIKAYHKYLKKAKLDDDILIDRFYEDYEDFRYAPKDDNFLEVNRAVRSMENILESADNYNPLLYLEMEDVLKPVLGKLLGDEA